MTQWERDHGKTYGVYFGPTPVVVVGDAVHAEKVMRASSKVFPDRPPIAVPVAPVSHSLIGLRGRAWRRVRRILAPMFAPGAAAAVLEPKIYSKLDKCMRNLETASAKGENNIVNMSNMCESLCFDVIACCGLGLDVDAQSNPDDELFTAIRAFLNRSLDGVITAAICCPELVSRVPASFAGDVVKRFGFLPKASVVLCDRIREVVRKRRAEGTRGRDVLQQMIDNAFGGEEEGEGVREDEGEERRRLSLEEVIANAWVFLLGGFDTTAQALVFTLRLLANNPKEQELLYREIISNVQDPEMPDIATVTNLPYLDQILKESLRMYPPVNLNVARRALSDFPLNETSFIPKGSNVHLPLWQLHRNPEYWDEPSKFCPARFLPGKEKTRPRMAYVPFGAGPRFCIGRDFAMIEVKLALARFVRHFRFEAFEGEKMQLVLPLVTLKSKSGIHLRCIRRREEHLS